MVPDLDIEALYYLDARYRKSRSVARTSSTPGFSTLMTTSFLLSLSTAKDGHTPLASPFDWTF